MTQAEFELHSLPHCANHANLLENARVSLLIEGLLRVLARQLDLQATTTLKAILEQGIQARDEKARSDARRKPENRGVEEEGAAIVLSMSAARMNMLVAVMST